MMWSHKAFGMYMGDVMAVEADTTRERDVMVLAIAREQAIERAATCAVETAPRAAHRIDTTRTTHHGRKPVAGAARS